MEVYSNRKELLAIIIEANDIEKEKNFVTENKQEMQIASFNLKKGTEILNHYHPEQERKITSTSEVITVIKGSLKVNIFDNDLNLVHSQMINSGETVALFSGGHGIEVMEDTKFIESKQGPYLEDIDKVRF